MSLSRAQAMVAAAAGSVTATVAAFALYGAGPLNYDTMWSIAWGRQVLSGKNPHFNVGPTPHPLPNALGTLVAPLGATAEVVVLVLGFIAAGAVVATTAFIAHRTFGRPTALGAALLALVLPPLMSATAVAFVDVPYTVLVLVAIALEIGRPRRGAATLGVLAVAGLMRPEAWLLSGAYWLWLTPTFRDRRSAILPTVLAGAAPAIWLGTDWLTTGDLLFGFHTTTAGAELSDTRRGASAVAQLPRFTANVAGKLICLVALVGFARALTSERGRLLFACLFAAVGAAALPVLLGTPLHERYFLAPFVLVCVFAAAGALSWIGQPAAGWRALGVACCVLVALQVWFNARTVEKRRDGVAASAHQQDAAKAVLMNGPIPCRPLVVPAGRVRMLAAVWRGVPLDQVEDAHDYHGRGTYLSGTPSAERDVVTFARKAGTAAEPPKDVTVARSGRGWQLAINC